MNNNTIAAISTANGPGGIGVIRISGEDALKIGDKIFKGVSNKNVSSMQGYTAAYGFIYDGDDKIDEAVMKICTENGYDYILNTDNRAYIAINPKNGKDITAKLKKELNIE